MLSDCKHKSKDQLPDLNKPALEVVTGFSSFCDSLGNAWLWFSAHCHAVVEAGKDPEKEFNQEMCGEEVQFELALN